MAPESVKWCQYCFVQTLLLERLRPFYHFLSLFFYSCGHLFSNDLFCTGAKEDRLKFKETTEPRWNKWFGTPVESVGKKSSATGNAGVSPAMSAERNEVERSANTALAAEILREVVVATGLVRASLRCASLALIAGGTPAFPGKSARTISLKYLVIHRPLTLLGNERWH